MLIYKLPYDFPYMHLALLFSKADTPIHRGIKRRKKKDHKTRDLDILKEQKKKSSFPYQNFSINLLLFTIRVNFSNGLN